MSTQQRLRVWVDHDKCVGSTLCIQLAPRVFRLDDNRQAVVCDCEGETAACITRAAEGCPQGAIVVEDAETEERLFP
jgi:ferredoxin